MSPIARSARRGALLAAGGVALGWAVSRRREAYDVRGRIVLVTGGSRGFGLVLARELARSGIGGLAICARDPGELERAREELARGGTRVFAVPADLSDRSEAERMVASVAAHFGRVDVLVNNAGIITVGPLETMSVTDFEEALATNFWAAVYTTLAVLPGMRARGEGRIVNVSSVGGKVPAPHLAPYTASKFALVGLSHALRVELAKDGIVVITACPGLMRTGGPRNADFKGRHRAEYAWFSIGDALPGLSMSAELAARRLVSALRRGDAEVALSLPARVAALAHAVAPGVTTAALGLVNRVLPGPGGIGRASAKGRESESAFSPSLLTALGDAAARRNNETAERSAS